jgi:hypothetical protein
MAEAGKTRPVTLILYVNAKLVLPSLARAISLRQSRGDIPDSAPDTRDQGSPSKAGGPAQYLCAGPFRWLS